MADTKADYSEASQTFIRKTVPSSSQDQERYQRSKAREAAYNENWKKQPVNINEICERFAPGAIGHRKGYKFRFRGERYDVITDMVAGYLRIYDRELKEYVKLDGTPGTAEETHFKILRREEM